ncbi:hypothetical protein EOD39_7843 [Acipenser ruthenus]|uniref:Uncharacterized protein n=1 Tax=Acipenser ruthenus TaxID=7906 RepID=A0A444U5T1_ACIRT|nr:hypothetical protein EOD39_7843 [Acipenser ruthenus]
MARKRSKTDDRTKFPTRESTGRQQPHRVPGAVHRTAAPVWKGAPRVGTARPGVCSAVGEKLGVLVADIEHLARRAFEDAPPELTKRLALDLFIHDLSLNELCHHVQLAHPRSITQAFEQLEELEAVMMEEARACHRSGTKAVRAGHLKGSDENDGEQEVELVCTSQTAQSPPSCKPPACCQCCLLLLQFTLTSEKRKATQTCWAVWEMATDRSKGESADPHSHTLCSSFP